MLYYYMSKLLYFTQSQGWGQILIAVLLVMVITTSLTNGSHGAGNPSCKRAACTRHICEIEITCILILGNIVDAWKGGSHHSVQVNKPGYPNRIITTYTPIYMKL